VIVGGESGPGFRPMDHAWARRVRYQCVQADVPFFFKQSAARRTEIGTQLVEADGSTTVWHQYPDEPPQPQRRAPRAGGDGGDGTTARGRSGSRQLPLGLGRKT
jgi:hypothetical protein